MRPAAHLYGRTYADEKTDRDEEMRLMRDEWLSWAQEPSREKMRSGKACCPKTVHESCAKAWRVC
jgi:hypothetical protein